MYHIMGWVPRNAGVDKVLMTPEDSHTLWLHPSDTTVQHLSLVAIIGPINTTCMKDSSTIGPQRRIPLRCSSLVPHTGMTVKDCSTGRCEPPSHLSIVPCQSPSLHGLRSSHSLDALLSFLIPYDSILMVSSRAVRCQLIRKLYAELG